MIKNTIRTILNSEAVLSIKDYFFINPRFYTKIPYGASCSDLFPWRESAEWQTRFDLYNISSLQFPELNLQEKVQWVVLDSSGTVLLRESFILDPFEKRLLLLSDFLKNKHGFGSFYVIHEPLKMNAFFQAKICLSERNYVAFRDLHQGPDKIWKYIHGNSSTVAQDTRTNGSARFLRNVFRKKFFYQPQMLFDDCESSDIFIMNPTEKKMNLKLIYFDKINNPIQEHAICVEPRASHIHRITQPEVFRIANESAIFLNRPIIFKYYKHNIDILHA